MTPPFLPLELTLAALEEGSTLTEPKATFRAYLRLEPSEASAEGFGVEGAVAITRTISRDAWEALGMPTVLPAVLVSVQK